VGPGELSIETWVKLGSGADAGLVELRSALGTSATLYTVWDAGNSNHEVFFRATGPTTVDFASSVRIQPDVWTHVVGSYNASDAFLFVDGVSTTDPNWFGESGPSIFNNNLWGRTTETGSTLDINGEVSGLRVWRDAVTPTSGNSVVNFDLSSADPTLLGNFQIGTNGDTTPLAGSPVGGNLAAQGASVAYTKNGTGTVTVTDDNFYQGPLTISAGTLAIGNNGTAGWVGGDITNDAALEFNRSDARDYSNAISGTGSVTKLANNTLTLSGSNSYTGSTTVSAGTLSLTGTLGATATTVGTGAIIEGNGTSAGTIAGAGTVAPGTAAAAEGILTFSSLDPSANTVFNLEFTSSDPNYADVANSNNDIVRLTAANAFDSAMTSANVVNIYLNDPAQPSFGAVEFRGGFFTDTRSNFLSSLQDATVNYFLRDDAGSVPYNGVNYTDVTSLDWVLQTVPANANFAGSTVNGQVLQVVPEPSSFALAGFAIAGLAAAGYRRRKAAKKAA
jgi:autotransporter-associated beta strand protein